MPIRDPDRTASVFGRKSVMKNQRSADAIVDGPVLCTIAAPMHSATASRQASRQDMEQTKMKLDTLTTARLRLLAFPAAQDTRPGIVRLPRQGSEALSSLHGRRAQLQEDRRTTLPRGSSGAARLLERLGATGRAKASCEALTDTDRELRTTLRREGKIG